MPLSLVQLPTNQREQTIDKHDVSTYEKVTKQTKKGHIKLVAEGFEEEVELEKVSMLSLYYSTNESNLNTENKNQLDLFLKTFEKYFVLFPQYK